jgi:peptide/nickel transport system substrate-binding protein
MMASVYIQDAILRPIIAVTPEGQAFPLLVKEIPTLENKKAVLIPAKPYPKLKTELEFLENAKWADGVPVTCEDLKTTWEIGNSPNVSTPGRKFYSNIESIAVDAKNPKKCTVTFSEARWDYLYSYPRPISSHIEKPIFEKYKNESQAYERNSGYAHDVTNPGLYNGPYKVTDLKIGSHVVLEPNIYFYGQAPAFKKLIFKFIFNSNTMEANLRTGQVDILSSAALSFDQALSFEKKIRSEHLPYEMIIKPGNIYSHIEFNLDHPILKDVLVRRALTMAVNRKEMVQSFFNGRQPVAYHFASPTDDWYTENPKEITIYPYSRAKAAELLDQAGWKMGKDGYRTKDGKKLSLVLDGVADVKLNEYIEVYLQDAWKKIGVQVSIKNMPSRVLFGEVLRKRDFEMVYYSNVLAPNDMSSERYTSDLIPSEKNAWSGSNRTGWRNPDVDRWMNEAVHEFDSKKRIVLMKKILKAYTDDLPGLPLYYRTVNSVIPAGFKNYDMSGHLYSEFLKIENWKY